MDVSALKNRFLVLAQERLKSDDFAALRRELQSPLLFATQWEWALLGVMLQAGMGLENLFKGSTRAHDDELVSLLESWVAKRDGTTARPVLLAPGRTFQKAIATAPAKPVSRGAAQDAAILAEIKNLGLDPLALIKNAPGKRGTKAAICTALLKNPLFVGSKVFDKAWERLTARTDIVCKP